MRTNYRKTNTFTLTIGLFFLFSLLSSTAFCAEITLSWSRPDDARVAGYNIYHGETGTNFKSAPDQSINAPDITSCSVSDLKEGQTYDFAATSVDANGNESDFSETVYYTVGSSETTDGENQLLVFGNTPDAHESGTLTDTFININEETNSTNEQLNTYTWPENTPANAILLKADLSALPDGAVIQSAVLHLYQTAAGGDRSYDLSVHKIINHNPELASANGYTYDGVNDWTANSDCYDDIPLAQADIDPAEDTNTLDQEPGYKQWNIAGMVQAWADNPGANYGLMINSDDSASSNSHRFFAASEAIDAGTRPKLEITYTVDPDDADNDGDGYSVNDGDCNDNDASIYPGAEEICGDGIDQNCDGSDAACPEEEDDTSNEGSDSESGDDGSSDADSGGDADNTDDQTDGTVSEDTQVGDVTLSWTRPDDDRVTGYNIYCGKSGTNFKSAPDAEIEPADTTSHTFADLESGYEYAFAATSLDANGNESDFSETVYYTIESEDPNDRDNDGDGYSVNDGDCNDNDASIYPGAEEICGDDIDQNCDGSDEICPEDMDQDGDGYTPNQGDCNDNDPSVYPGAEEICGDGIDQDCDGRDLSCPDDENTGTTDGTDPVSGDDGSDSTTTEDPATSSVTLSWSRPNDDRVTGYNIYCGKSGTNFKSAPDAEINSPDTTSHTFADLESGYEYAFAATSVDANGNESDFSETVYYILDPEDPNDRDNDGDGYSVNEGDCNDNDPSIYPGAEEICGDGIDQNCDGSDLACPDDETISTEETTSEQDTIDSNQEPESDTSNSDDETNDQLNLSEGSLEQTIEFAEIEINHEWQPILFNKIFYDPVIVAKPMSLNGSDPGVIRIKNLNWEGFDIRIQEWDYLDGWHKTEKASYLAVEAGRHELPNSTQMEAGTFETNSSRNVDFSQPFNQKPVVICTITTENEVDAVTGRIYNITKDGFDFQLQEQQANKDGHSTLETISFIAWEPSSDTIDGISYIVDTTFNEVTNELHPITFYPSFENNPAFIADMQTLDGKDPANIRWKNKTNKGIEVQIDEEQSKNTETNHTTEVVGYMVFD